VYKEIAADEKSTEVIGVDITDEAVVAANLPPRTRLSTAWWLPHRTWVASEAGVAPRMAPWLYDDYTRRRSSCGYSGFARGSSQSHRRTEACRTALKPAVEKAALAKAQP
jgi:hypothetical protein